MRVLSLCIFLLILMFGTLYTQMQMTMDDYNVELNQWKMRETKSKNEIAELKTINKNLQEINSITEEETQTIWDTIYMLVGGNQSQIDMYLKEIDDLKQKISEFDMLPDNQKKNVQSELNKRLALAQENKMSALTKAYQTIPSLEKQMVLLNLKMKK